MYNRNKWYWHIKDNNTAVFSSVAMAFVPLDNATYEAWLEAGNFPTIIGSAQDLYGVVAGVYNDQLAVYDTTLPRSVEDLIEAYELDPTKMPAIQQQRMASKATIRANIAALKVTLGIS